MPKNRNIGSKIDKIKIQSAVAVCEVSSVIDEDLFEEIKAGDWKRPEIDFRVNKRKKWRVLHDPDETETGLKFGGFYDVNPCAYCGQYFGRDEFAFYKYCSVSCQKLAETEKAKERMRRRRERGKLF